MIAYLKVIRSKTRL